MADIQTLKAIHLEQAAISLSEAFATDPHLTWIFPDFGERIDALRIMNRVFLRYAIKQGYALTSHEGRAVAVWIPARARVSVIGMICCGLLSVPFRVGFRPFLSTVTAHQTMQSFHERFTPEPHWHLLSIGVDPALQGQGIGTALLNAGLARADRDQASCCLETSAARALPLYERLGFKIVGSAPLGKGAPPGWAMRREPQGPGTAMVAALARAA